MGVMLSFFVYSDLNLFGITQLQYNKMTCEKMEDHFFFKFKFITKQVITNVHEKLEFN